MAQTAPGMMLQFGIAGLLTAAQVIVAERKSRCLQRLLTTRLARYQILLGHYLAIFAIIFVQFMLLIVFGQLVMHLDYLRQPLATLLMAFTSALFIAGLGLLIGALAKSDEQAILFALLPMFVFAGLGGAWVPLESTGARLPTDRPPHPGGLGPGRFQRHPGARPGPGRGGPARRRPAGLCGAVLRIGGVEIQV